MIWRERHINNLNANNEILFTKNKVEWYPKQQWILSEEVISTCSLEETWKGEFEVHTLAPHTHSLKLTNLKLSDG